MQARHVAIRFLQEMQRQVPQALDEASQLPAGANKIQRLPLRMKCCSLGCHAAAALCSETRLLGSVVRQPGNAPSSGVLKWAEGTHAASAT